MNAAFTSASAKVFDSPASAAPSAVHSERRTSRCTSRRRRLRRIAQKLRQNCARIAPELRAHLHVAEEGLPILLLVSREHRLHLRVDAPGLEGGAEVGGRREHALEEGRLAHLRLPRRDRVGDCGDGGEAFLQRVDDARLGEEVGEAFDHQHGLGGAGDDEVELAAARRHLRLRRVDHELVADEDDAHRRHRLGEGHLRDGERCGRSADRHHVGQVLAVGGEDVRGELRLERPAVAEERAERPVDQPAHQRLVVGGAAVALDVPAGGAADARLALDVVDAQRREVERRHLVLALEARRAQHVRAARLAHHRAARQPADLARLEAELLARHADAHRLRAVLERLEHHLAVGQHRRRRRRRRRRRLEVAAIVVVERVVVDQQRHEVVVLRAAHGGAARKLRGPRNRRARSRQRAERDCVARHERDEGDECGERERRRHLGGRSWC